MSDIQGGNLVFKGVFDDSDINRGFERAKREIQQMSGALQDGVLDTENIPDLHTLAPARTLTEEEARELWADLDRKY